MTRIFVLQPPDCDKTEHSYRRRRSASSEIDLEEDANEPLLRYQEIRDLSVEVHSGLYVNEADDDEESKLTLLIMQNNCQISRHLRPECKLGLLFL